MAEQEEQQTEKKKAGIAKPIFKWLGLGLLTLLLIVSIIFQAPWKIITLLAIILLACTVLPKAYRKYFWLCVGGVVIALIVWVFLPEETEGWRSYTFDEELAELQAKYAIPDEENAAILYNQLLEDYNKASFEPNFIDPNLEHVISTEFWPSEDYPEASQWIGQHKDTIPKLIKATQIEQCRFPIDYDIMRNDITNRLASMRRWAYLLVSAANNDVAEGRTNRAIEKYIAVIQMGKHLRQQPALIDILVGIGIGVVPRLEMNRLMVEEDNTTEEHLLTIEKAITGTEFDWSIDLQKFLECEKLYAKNFLGMFYGISPEGKIRLNPSAATRAMKCQMPEDMKDKLVTTYWRERLMKAQTIWFWFYMPPTPQKGGEIIDLAYKRFYAMAEPDYDWGREPARAFPCIRLNYRFMVEYLVSILEETFRSIHDTYIRYNAQQRGGRIIIALRRYKNKNGSWPVSLDEVKSLAPKEIFTDPINGGSFVYKSTGEDFILYSKGKNGIDENCRRSSDDWLIWTTGRPKYKRRRGK